MLIVGFFAIRAIFVKDNVKPLETYEGFMSEQLTEQKYSSYLNLHQLNRNAPQIEIDPLDMRLSPLVSLVDPSNARDYGSNIVALNRNDTVSFDVTVTSDAIYQIYIDYMYIGTELFSPKFGLQIDDAYPFYESRQLTLPIVWRPDIETSNNGIQDTYLFQQDRYGSDTQPRSENVELWLTDGLYDASYYEAEPLEFYFSAGTHEVTIESRNDGILFGFIRLMSKATPIGYDLYQTMHENKTKYDEVIKVEAEFLKEKIRPIY